MTGAVAVPVPGEPRSRVAGRPRRPPRRWRGCCATPAPASRSPRDRPGRRAPHLAASPRRPAATSWSRSVATGCSRRWPARSSTRTASLGHRAGRARQRLRPDARPARPARRPRARPPRGRPDAGRRRRRRRPHRARQRLRRRRLARLRDRRPVPAGCPGPCSTPTPPSAPCSTYHARLLHRRGRRRAARGGGVHRRRRQLRLLRRGHAHRPGRRPSPTASSTWSWSVPPPSCAWSGRLPKLYDGSHVDLDEVTVLRGKSVRLSASRPRHRRTATANAWPPSRSPPPSVPPYSPSSADPARLVAGPTRTWRVRRPVG